MIELRLCNAEGHQQIKTQVMLNKGKNVAKGSKSATGEQKSAKSSLIQFRLADSEVMPLIQTANEKEEEIWTHDPVISPIKSVSFKSLSTKFN